MGYLYRHLANFSGHTAGHLPTTYTTWVLCKSDCLRLYLRRCKNDALNWLQVVLCCLTPRYAVSESCTKEISLADLLRKPIVPIMIERTPWPPPGPLAMLLSQLIYIDLAGEFFDQNSKFGVKF